MQQDTAARPVGAPVPLTFDTVDLMVDGFLARFDSAQTRTAYAGDLALWRRWCAEHGVDPLTVERSHIEFFARHLQGERGNSRATVHRRLVALRSFYRVLVDDRVLEHSPAEAVRLPKVTRDKSTYTWITRSDLSAMLAAADEATSPTDAALIALMGIMGLRVSETCGIDVDDIDRYTDGHRMIDFVAKGGAHRSLPVPPAVGRRLDTARSGRTSGPLLVRRDGSRMDRRSADRVVKRIAKAARVDKPVSPHDLRAAAISLALAEGVSLRYVQHGIGRHADARQTEWYDRSIMSLDRHPAYQLASAVA